MLRGYDERLAHFSEIDSMEIRATHATHDGRNEKDAYNPVNAIYKHDLCSGWIGLMDLTRPTARCTEHEITTLKQSKSV